MNSRNLQSVRASHGPNSRTESVHTVLNLRAGLMAWTLGLILILASAGSLSAQCELACKPPYTPIVLDMDGNATITPILVLNNYPDPNCPGNVTLTITDGAGNPVDPMVDCDRAGDTLMITAKHDISGNSCWTSVVVVDEMPPMLICPDKYVFCTDTLLADSVGYPQWMEACMDITNADFYSNDLYTNLPCTTQVNNIYVTGKVARQWAVTDLSGNTGTCQQTIWLKRATIADVEFPGDHDGFDLPALMCGEDPKDLKLTGQPTVDGFPLITLGSCDFTVTYSDDIYPGCVSGAYTTIRTWKLIDYCQDTTVYHAQIISLMDMLPPVVQAPADITIGTSSIKCSATVNLPTGTSVTDNCSSYTVSVKWAYGTGYGPYLNVPTGIHPVIYEAKDACGNIGRDTMYLTILDDDKPVAVCKKDVNIALPSTGIITVPASLFDDGSYDNCLLDHLEVSRDNGAFMNEIMFMCSDIGKNIMVALKAVDHVGLSNTCMMVVLVQDKLEPMITCPDDITVLCSDDIKQLSKTGAASGMDNCQMKSVTYVDNKFLNQCKEGYLNRQWTAEDIYGNKSYCLQVITQVDTTPIKIVWPANFSSTECGVDVSPAKVGQPVITGNDCENLFVSYTDKLFMNSYPACYRIERCWEVKNWCTYNANLDPNPGHWKGVQYIDVYDQEEPIMTIPSDITIGTDQQGCYGYLNVATAVAMDCDPNTVISNNSPYAISGGASIDGTYPVGVHTIMFVAQDGCGNSSMATMKVTVADDKPPLAICNKGVSIGLNMTGTVTLPLNLIEGGSFDNCTGYAGLSFNLVPNTFSCDSLGSQLVTMTVVDGNGNVNTCTTIVEVQDNLDVCSKGKSQIKGSIYTPGGDPMAKAEVYLNGLDMTLTEANGTYTFNDLPKGVNYTITPELDKEAQNGLSIGDIILLQKHILGKQAFTDPYQIIAADVNKSGNISISDLIEIRRLLLGQEVAFANAPSWQFVTSDYVFTNPNKPTQENYAQQILIPNIQGDYIGQNFVAVKTGDVNYTAKASGLLTGDVRTGNLVDLALENPVMTAGYTYRIPVRVPADDLLGFQFQLGLNPARARFVRFEEGACSTVHPEMVRLTDDHIRMVWHSLLPDPAMASQPVLWIEIEALQTGLLSEAIQLEDDLLSEAMATDLVPSEMILRFVGEAQSNGVLLEDPYPNPFSRETQIRFNLTQPAAVTLRVFNMTGSEVWRHEADFSQGSHALTLPATTLGRSGLYQLLIETSYTRPVTRSLVLLDE